MTQAMRLAGTIAVLCVAATGVSAAERYYAYVTVPTLDYQRQHVVDQSGQQAFDGACVVWEPGWETSVDYVPLEVENVMRWYTGLGYTIDASSKTVTFKSFSAPMVADKDGERRRIGPDQMVPNFSVTVPLTAVRPAGCSDNWVKVWTQNEYVATHGYPPSVGPRSGQSAPVESDISKSIINGIRQRVQQEQQNRSLCGNPGGCGSSGLGSGLRPGRSKHYQPEPIGSDKRRLNDNSACRFEDYAPDPASSRRYLFVCCWTA